MTRARTARERARNEVTGEIKRAATAQLAAVGAAALSLRAVARDVGMVSSAVYRYFPSRDALLTALIVDAYDDLGATAERTHADAAGKPAGECWLLVCRAVRSWARASPHRWSLLYGSPVPGYAAPPDTIGPAVRLNRVMAQILVEAAGSQQLTPPARVLPEPRVTTPEVADVADAEIPPAHADLLERALVLMIGLVGSVSYELFGHLAGAISDHDTYFDRVVALVAETAGLEVPLPANR